MYMYQILSISVKEADVVNSRCPQMSHAYLTLLAKIPLFSMTNVQQENEGAKLSAYNTFVLFILSPSEVTMVLQTKSLQSKWTQVLAMVTEIARSKAMKVAKLKFAFSN